MPNFMKIRPVRAKLFHADRRIDVTQLTIAFYNFANVPKIKRRTSHPPNQKFASLLGIRKYKPVSIA